ncbi:MAG: hypothetical protein ACRD5F_03585 [Candidatus Acidiferrales bacterium]
MICWFCRHILTDSPAYEAERETTDGTRLLRLACWHCGARFEIAERLLRQPAHSAEYIEHIRNIPR